MTKKVVISLGVRRALNPIYFIWQDIFEWQVKPGFSVPLNPKEIITFRVTFCSVWDAEMRRTLTPSDAPERRK